MTEKKINQPKMVVGIQKKIRVKRAISNLFQNLIKLFDVKR